MSTEQKLGCGTVIVISVLVWGGMKSCSIFTDQSDVQPITAPTMPVVQENQSKTTIPSTPEISDSDQMFICRAAISAMMGRPINIISAKKMDKFTVGTSYVRSSDGKKWENLCKVNGNTINWASVFDGQRGRWRNSAKDEKVKYLIEGSLLNIIQEFGDGSEITNSYAIQK